MARSLSNAMLKGVAGLPATHCLRTMVCGSSYHHVMRYSVSESRKFGAYDDFKPTGRRARFASSDPDKEIPGGGPSSYAKTAKQRIEMDLQRYAIVIYMKGLPKHPACGFSSLAARVLRLYPNVNKLARDIWTSPELKKAVVDFSKWPTFPQIFVKGQLIGGLDILLKMHQSGELIERLTTTRAKQDQCG